jgi:hypothetical protein
MHCNDRTTRERDTCLENFAAELTEAAYPVALRIGAGIRWLELKLDLWRRLTETVKNVAARSASVSSQRK